MLMNKKYRVILAIIMTPVSIGLMFLFIKAGAALGDNASSEFRRLPRSGYVSLGMLIKKVKKRLKALFLLDLLVLTNSMMASMQKNIGNSNAH
jgi:hypothetical protein